MGLSQGWWERLARMDKIALVVLLGWVVALLFGLPPSHPSGSGAYVHFGEGPSIDALATGIVYESWIFALGVGVGAVGSWLVIRPLLVRSSVPVGQDDTRVPPRSSRRPWVQSVGTGVALIAIGGGVLVLAGEDPADACPDFGQWMEGECVKVEWVAEPLEPAE